MYTCQAAHISYYLGCLPENASSGKTRRSISWGSALERTASARFRLLLTSPSCGANCKQPMRIVARVGDEVYGRTKVVVIEIVAPESGLMRIKAVSPTQAVKQNGSRKIAKENKKKKKSEANCHRQGQRNFSGREVQSELDRCYNDLVGPAHYHSNSCGANLVHHPLCRLQVLVVG